MMTMWIDADESRFAVCAAEQWLIRKFSRAGLSIASFYAGTGTTAIAAVREGRDCICIDKDKDSIRHLQTRLLSFKHEMEDIMVRFQLLQPAGGKLQSPEDLFKSCVASVPVWARVGLQTVPFGIRAKQEGFTEAFDAALCWWRGMTMAELRINLDKLQENPSFLLTQPPEKIPWAALKRRMAEEQQQQLPFQVRGPAAAGASGGGAGGAEHSESHGSGGDLRGAGGAAGAGEAAGEGTCFESLWMQAWVGLRVKLVWPH
jgi:hypothetical protein